MFGIGNVAPLELLHERLKGFLPHGCVHVGKSGGKLLLGGTVQALSIIELRESGVIGAPVLRRRVFLNCDRAIRVVAADREATCLRVGDDRLILLAHDAHRARESTKG